MENTPMQELIEIIKNHAETYKGKEELRVKKAYLDIVCAIEDFKLLEKEKQVIEDAWESGNENITYDENYGYDRTETFQDYYNQKFKQ